VTTCVEHPSVEEPLRALEERGLEVRRLPVDGGGRVDAAEAASALGEPTALLAVIWAQNETGVLQPVEDLVEAARARGVWVHLDATQAVGKIPVDLRRVPAQLLSASAHKFGGPKGAGFLVERGGAALPAWIRGGPQERRRRGGTENVAGIVGLGVACALSERELDARRREQARLRDRLWEGIRAKVPRVRRNGDAAHVLPNTLNVEFEGTDGEALLQALDLEGIAVSAGAACHSGSLSPSPVLLAMGLTPGQAAASLRLSVGQGSSDADVERVLLVLPDLVARVREAAAS
jgi:cysteine desulfurase